MWSTICDPDVLMNTRTGPVINDQIHYRDQNSRKQCLHHELFGTSCVSKTGRSSTCRLFEKLKFLFSSWRSEWVVSRWTSSTSWAPRPCSTSPSTAWTPRCGQQDPRCTLHPQPWASRPGRGRGSRPETSWSRSYPGTTAGWARTLLTWSPSRTSMLRFMQYMEYWCSNQPQNIKSIY